MFNFSYLTIGNQKNPPLLFLHGFMGKKEDWDQITTKLKDFFYCICIDLPGHGETSIPEEYSFNELKNDLLHFIKKKNSNNKINIIGYSMGGRITTELLITAPTLFDKVILESSSFGIEKLVARQERLSADKKIFQNIHSNTEKRSFLNHWYQLPIFGNISKHPKFEFFLEDKVAGNFKNWQIALSHFSVGRQKQLSAQVQALSLKILYINGEKDLKYQEVGDKFTQNSPLLHHFTVKNSGHNTHFEDPETFTSVAKKFLSP